MSGFNRYKFELYSRRTLRGKRWFFRYKAPNGETMFQSEGYHNIGDAQTAITTLKDTVAYSKTVLLNPTPVTVG